MIYINNINDRINKIDELLNDNSLLENYIKEIENTHISMPPNLESTLISKYTNTKKHILFENSIKILKIAACTIFTLAIWNTSLSKPIVLKKAEKGASIQIQSNIDNKLKSVSEFLLTPLKLERNDK